MENIEISMRSSAYDTEGMYLIQIKNIKTKDCYSIKIEEDFTLKSLTDLIIQSHNTIQKIITTNVNTEKN